MNKWGYKLTISEIVAKMNAIEHRYPKGTTTLELRELHPFYSRYDKLLRAKVKEQNMSTNTLCLPRRLIYTY